MGMPGKNVGLINGKPACEWGFIAGRSDDRVTSFYCSTDSPKIAAIGAKYNYQHISRPPELATPAALTEDALVHAHRYITSREDYDAMVLVFANNPAINHSLLSEAITKLSQNSAADSVFSVSLYNMFSPARARRIEDGAIQPFVPLKHLDNVSSIRDTQGDCYFCDLAIQVIRSRVFENIDSGQLPFKWQGKLSLPVFNDFGFDIDEPWQRHVIDYWLQSYTNSNVSGDD